MGSRESVGPASGTNYEAKDIQAPKKKLIYGNFQLISGKLKQRYEVIFLGPR